MTAAPPCARRGCPSTVPPGRRRFCSDACRRTAANARRTAGRRAARAASDAARRTALLEAVERLYYISLAARQAGIDPSTAYAWMRADADFAAAVETARSIASDAHEGHLLSVARAADPDLARLRAAEAVCRRIDANEARRRAAARRPPEAAPQPDADCADALAWARRPRLEAV